MKEYTVKAGQQAARPLVFGVDSGRNPFAGWRMSLGKGWDYVLESNEDQWLKLCGETFNPVNRDKNAVMLAARRAPGEDWVELSPYYNVDGEQFYYENQDYPADWPVVRIPISEKRDFFYSYRTEKVRVTATIMLSDGSRYLHRFVHKGIGCFQSEVNFYFGGSIPAPQDISLWKEKLDVLEWGL